jgi:hypothetical protein
MGTNHGESILICHSIEQFLQSHGMQPLSASIKPSDDTHSQATDIYTYPRIPSQFQSIRQHIHRHTHSTKPTGDPKTDGGSDESQTLQVAVAVAMPSLHGPPVSDTQTHGPHDVEPLDYSLGLMEIPWHSKER